MPRGDEKHKQIYDALVDVLGEDYVSDDPVVMEAFSRDGMSPSILTKGRVEFIVLPGSTEDVQQIVRLANRYKFPYSVASTGLSLLAVSAIKPYWCYIDPKRMTHWEIDKENMYVVVEPYVNHAQVQAEAMKRGLFKSTGGFSSQASVLANNVFQNGVWTAYRVGRGRNLLGVEWVLPNGDVLRTGSLAMPGGDYCWGEGPGPDLRGLLRAANGNLGALGVVTKVAVKLYPWPGPPSYPTEGVVPEKRVVLPPDKFKTYYFTYPSLEACIDALYEICRTEIGWFLGKWAPLDFILWWAKSREEFWDSWWSGYWQENTEHMVSIGLWSFAGERQVKYEEKVLMQVIKDTGGKLIPDEVKERLDSFLLGNVIRDTHRTRIMGRGGRFVFTGGGGSLDECAKVAKLVWPVYDKYLPPLLCGGHPAKFWLSDFGHWAVTEIDSELEKTDENDELNLQVLSEIEQVMVENSIVPERLLGSPVPISGEDWLIPHFKLLGRLKEALDPNNLANPGRMIHMDVIKKKGII